MVILNQMRPIILQPKKHKSIFMFPLFKMCLTDSVPCPKPQRDYRSILPVTWQWLKQPRAEGAAERGEVGGDINIPGLVPIGTESSITLHRGSSSITSSSTHSKLGRCLLTKLEAGSVSGELVRCSLSPGTIRQRTKEDPLVSCPGAYNGGGECGSNDTHTCLETYRW